MKTYKAPDNSLHVIEPEFSHLLPAGCVEIDDAEAEALRAPTPEQLAAIAAAETEAAAAAALAAQEAAIALEAKEDAVVSIVAGFSMTQVDEYVELHFGNLTNPQKDFLKAVGKICVIGARKL